ncbi:MAG: hypothetical protein IJT00_00025 [Lachnospiraceae bacterium]|nr:hypothetical protein [Lachnospiraceae bacterium]
MDYGLTVFGVKDSSEDMIRFLHGNVRKIDLVISVSDSVRGKNDIAGGTGLKGLEKELGIPVFEADSYLLKDEATLSFIAENEFDLGICMGWQRLIPVEVLSRFRSGVFGFHGNAGYLPFGRGRSPLNWSMILGDTRFNLNLFRYDENPDSPNVFATETFEITPFDDIRTAQYKNQILSRRLAQKLVRAWENGEIIVNTESKDYDSWYEKRTAKDGRLDMKARTREIYNLIRGVSAPFPGAFCFVEKPGTDPVKITVWEARPFDQIIDLSGFAPGEIAFVFENRPVIRTVDGSLIINKYESEDGSPLKAGDILK